MNEVNEVNLFCAFFLVFPFARLGLLILGTDCIFRCRTSYFIHHTLISSHMVFTAKNALPLHSLQMVSSSQPPLMPSQKSKVADVTVGPVAGCDA